MDTEKRNVFWGVLLLVGAVALLADKLGFIEGVSFWAIFFTAILGTVLVKSIIKKRFGMLLFAAAFLVIVNDEVLHLEAITPWPVLIAAGLGTLGLKLLFPDAEKKNNHLIRIGNGNSVVDDYSWSGDRATYTNVFGESVKYIAEEFRSIKLKNVFGSMEIFFTDAKLKDGSAEVLVDNVFGSVELYVPSSWKVLVDMERFASNVDDCNEQNRKCCPDGENTLRIVGSVRFGNFEIVYV